MSKSIRVFVNGIMTVPGSSKNWNGKAVTWCHTEAEILAEKVEYFVDPLFRSMGQHERAGKLVKTLSYYLAKGFEVHIIGHSNGADVILDALQQMNWPRIKSLHLIAPACEANWNDNGLNVGWVSFERIVVYIGGEDLALQAADTVLGRLLGYGILGKDGPVEPSGPVEVVRYPDFGHSDWFSPANFDETMRMLTQ